MEPTGANVRSGGDLLVQCLLEHDMSLWSCVPGESFLPVLDALHERGDRVRLITARHEAAAANMAEAAGKLTGRAAVCLVTRGPGATHASIALHTAYQDGTPLILVVGQVERRHLGRQAFQEMNYEHVFGSSAKAVVTVMDADRIPEHVARAVATAHGGRPGPVVLVLPEDVLSDRTDAPVMYAPEPACPDVTAADRDRLLVELNAAERPVLIVGGPGWRQSVGEQVIAFAERNDVPVAAAFRWQDAVPNASRAFVGYLGLGCSPKLRARLAEADLIVGLGPRLDDPTTDGYALTDTARRLVLVSEAADELYGGAIPHLALHGSLASVADALKASHLRENASRRGWLPELRAEQERFTSPPVPAPQPDLASIVSHVRNTVPDDAVITNGAGNYTVWLQRFFEFRRFHTQLAPRNGAMGYGLPAGLAAAALHPDRVVVTFAGDGCLLMSGSELATAVKYGLRVVVVVVNNSMFGTIRMHQERAYPGRVIATQLHNPDFVAYARSFGAAAHLVRTTGEFAPAFAEALSHHGPSLIEVRTDAEQITPDLRIADLG
ncbi:thiamine pyrophosphate-dependent enzyme [Amycolatopsis pithecellobii]|uniref:Thiamine pyrophosphate-binding protein n=1 Tax=Amycolatopsis pithecellobii TaxID=664692 RepID=A0A6N7YW73_9PSEU|nr:thiamine pyrophosphate-dependent enzyme [Amycolatopsis pithecellobii]MTD53123.1 thiamine pyrophosphate-binding protein [Amycolatopsis pithecellobii]